MPPIDIRYIETETTPWLRRAQIEDSIGTVKAVRLGVIAGGIVGIPLGMIIRWDTPTWTGLGIVVVLMGIVSIYSVIRLGKLRTELVLVALEEL